MTMRTRLSIPRLSIDCGWARLVSSTSPEIGNPGPMPRTTWSPGRLSTQGWYGSHSLRVSFQSRADIQANGDGSKRPFPDMCIARLVTARFTDAHEHPHWRKRPSSTSDPPARHSQTKDSFSALVPRMGPYGTGHGHQHGTRDGKLHGVSAGATEWCPAW